MHSKTHNDIGNTFNIKSVLKILIGEISDQILDIKDIYKRD